MMRRKVKLQSGYGFLLFLLIQFSLLVFVYSEGEEQQNKLSMKRKRSTDNYYNAYSRPDYNSKSNSRQLTSSSTGSSYYDSQVGEDFGNYAAASHSGGYGHSSGGHGGGHGGGGYGGGGGHGGGGGYGHGGGGGGHGGGHGKGSNVNSSAVGLLGFLALLSLIQNVLRQMTTTAAPTMAPMGRKKRSFNDSFPALSSSSVDDARITTLVLPMLTAVAHARDGLVPHECVHRPVCLANKVLVDQLGDHGTNIGTLVTNAVGKLLHPFPMSYDSVMEKEDTVKNNKNKKTPTGFGGKTKNKKTTMSTSLVNRNREKLIEAGKNGRRKNSKGGECDTYEYCNVLNNLPVYGLPPSGQFV